MFQKYSFNTHYFEKIESPSQAYFLGFLMADGSNQTERSRISVEIHSKDSDVLSKLLAAVEHSDHSAITTRTRVNRFSPDQSNIYHRVTLCSAELSRDLSKHGMVKAKTKNFTFPDIEEHLLSHYLRGLTDGDGSICFSEATKNPSWNLITPTSSIDQTSSVIEKYTGIIPYRNKHPRSESIQTLMINGGRKTPLFLRWLYKDAADYLERKYHKSQQILHYAETQGRWASIIPPIRATTSL